MKTIAFNNTTAASRKKALLIGMIYMIVLFTVCYFAFGGIFGMADKLDRLGNSKAAIFIIGIIALAPVFVIIAIIHPRTKVEIEAGKMKVIVKNKPDEIILLSAIEKMEFNIPKINKLYIYGRNGEMLYDFSPANNHKALQQIVNGITAQAAFNCEAKKENYFGKQIEKSVYTKKQV